MRRRTPKTYTAPNGVRYRICRACKKHKALRSTNFSVAKRDYRGRPIEWNGHCRRCAVAQKKLWRRTVRETKPDHEQRVKERQRAVQKRWREQNPDKVKASVKRRAAAIKADPERHARELERRRIEWHLRGERQGRKPKAKNGNARKVKRKVSTRVPTAPLVALVEKMVATQDAVAALTLDRAAITEVCRQLGITDRTLRRWREGDIVEANVGTVERILLNAHVDWRQVYPEDYAPVFEP